MWLQAWLPIVYWVFAGSCVGYSCCSLANSVLPASIVSAYTCLQPLVGVVFSWILNHEPLAWRDAGGILIICGLLLTSFGAGDDAEPKQELAHVQGPTTCRCAFAICKRDLENGTEKAKIGRRD